MPLALKIMKSQHKKEIKQVRVSRTQELIIFCLRGKKRSNCQDLGILIAMACFWKKSTIIPPRRDILFTVAQNLSQNILALS